MRHEILVEQLEKEVGLAAHGMVQAVEACVHCGFCLPACPTYQELGEEMDSPRGRIFLMKNVLEGQLAVQDAIPYIDRCLGCLACTTACPSGVDYESLLVPFRGYAEQKRTRSLAERAQRLAVHQTLPHPGRFRLATLAGKPAKLFSKFLPDELKVLLEFLPPHLPGPQPLPEYIPAVGPRRARVALLAGCVQQVLSPELGWAALRVLALNGVEVVVPTQQGCCGALQIHTGDLNGARQLAARNLNAFPTDVDAILTTAAGCGSGMKTYGMLFEGRPEEASATVISRKVQDISAFLGSLGVLEPPPLPRPLRLAYHDACHLAHAQGIRQEPRSLLTAIPNLTLLEIAESELCCGSAGTYNLEQPEIAARLGQRKVSRILDASPEAVAAGNIGCIVQIRSHLEKMGKPLPVYHTIEILDFAYRNEIPGKMLRP
jgi:glycolate oxidase iron-sulfur subunit